MSAGARFWSKVELTDNCWLWAASTSHDGYGQFRVGKTMRYAHVVAWEEEHGLKPAGKELDHVCRVRRCVRPSHLELVSHRENVIRGASTAAARAAATACIRGHALSGRNLAITKGGYRRCRECDRQRHAGLLGVGH